MNLDHIVNTWAGISTWLFPVILLILGITLITRYRHTAGIALIVAAIAEFFHDYLFLYSDFTSGWETDCVTCVSYDYKPLGFLAANLLPAIWNVSIVIAFLLVIRSIFNKKNKRIDYQLTICSIILSGGRATRMNSVDKGLVLLQDKPLIEHVIARLQPQVDEIFINANREILQYEAFGYAVLQDENDGFLGPLAGFSLGLQHAKHDYVLTVPCDSPLLPLDLAQRLMAALLEHRADIAVASSDENTHPVFCLMKKSVLPSLLAYIESGERKVSTWQKSQKYVVVDFSDCSEAFTNLNTFEDLEILEAKLA